MNLKYSLAPLKPNLTLQQQTTKAQQQKNSGNQMNQQKPTNSLFFNAISPSPSSISSPNPIQSPNVNRSPSTIQSSSHSPNSAMPTTIPSNSEFDFKVFFKDTAEKIKKEIEMENERKKQHNDSENLTHIQLASKNQRKRKRDQFMQSSSTSSSAKKIYGGGFENFENTWEQRRADEALERYLRNSKFMAEIFNFSGLSEYSDDKTDENDKIGFENEEWSQNINMRIDAISDFLVPRLKKAKNTEKTEGNESNS